MCEGWESHFINHPEHLQRAESDDRRRPPHTERQNIYKLPACGNPFITWSNPPSLLSVSTTGLLHRADLQSAFFLQLYSKVVFFVCLTKQAEWISRLPWEEGRSSTCDETSTGLHPKSTHTAHTGEAANQTTQTRATFTLAI